MSLTIELVNCEKLILGEIADPAMKRLDVAKTYWWALRSSESTKMDWGRVNRAIIARWSKSALHWIKRQAWKDELP